MIIKYKVYFLFNRKGNTPVTTPTSEEDKTIEQPQVIASDDDYYDGQYISFLHIQTKGLGLRFGLGCLTPLSPIFSGNTKCHYTSNNNTLGDVMVMITW
jgi:hypothetical protein